MQKIQAAVLPRKGGPLKIESLDMEGPRENEVLVRIVATGICRTDIDVCDDWDGATKPVVLGHERKLVKVSKELPLEVLAPLGCGIQTGAGTVMNSLEVQAGASTARLVRQRTLPIADFLQGHQGWISGLAGPFPPGRAAPFPA